MYRKFKLEKVIVSIALGKVTLSEIEKVTDHFLKLFQEALIKKGNLRKCVITRCRKSNATFKIRKGNPLGAKITLRKDTALKFLEIVNRRVPFLNAKYNSSTLELGVDDHRTLRLERYNYTSPSYGFNVICVFRKVSDRLYKRRISPIKKGYVVPEGPCREMLKEMLR